MNRYKRQISLAEVGELGQRKLLKASVLCVGAGGLGAPALLYLVAAGVGRIGIIDFDTVDESNLQRQVLYTTGDVGKSKAIAAGERLKALNPQIEIAIYNCEFDLDAATKILPQYDFILDGTDNFEAKFLINDAAVKYKKPWIYGAIQGFDGQAGVFNYEDGPCYRCLFPEKPRGHIMNCAEAGVIGAVAGLIGITQALQVIQIIIENGSFEPLSGKILTLDTRTLQTRILRLKKKVDCAVCSLSPEEITLNYKSPVCGIISEILPNQIIIENDNCVIIDVREQEEWDFGHIKTAKLWPLSKIVASKIPDLPLDTKIILYCQKGIRSLQAAHILKDRGYKNISSLAGGYEAWLKENKS